MLRCGELEVLYVKESAGRFTLVARGRRGRKTDIRGRIRKGTLLWRIRRRIHNNLGRLSIGDGDEKSPSILKTGHFFHAVLRSYDYDNYNMVFFIIKLSLGTHSRRRICFVVVNLCAFTSPDLFFRT